MHYLRSGKALRVFRFGALLLLLLMLNSVLPALLVPVGLFMSDPKILWAALYILGGLPVTALFYILWASRARCPLCLNPSLVTRKCAKHRAARTLAGSYRLYVALPVLFTGRFTCPYCGEQVRCRVRDRNRPRRSSSGMSLK